MHWIIAAAAIAFAFWGAWIWRVRYRALRRELVAIRALVEELVEQGKSSKRGHGGPSDSI